MPAERRHRSIVETGFEEPISSLVVDRSVEDQDEIVGGLMSGAVLQKASVSDIWVISKLHGHTIRIGVDRCRQRRNWQRTDDDSLQPKASALNRQRFDDDPVVVVDPQW
jgi:hypothetical protein